MPARHDLFWACQFRSSGAEIDPQQQISIPETECTAATVITVRTPHLERMVKMAVVSVRLETARWVKVRRVGLHPATVRTEIVPLDPAATAVVLMALVRVVYVPAVDVQHVHTDNVPDVPTASVATVNAQVETV